MLYATRKEIYPFYATILFEYTVDKTSFVNTVNDKPIYEIFVSRLFYSNNDVVLSPMFAK